MPDWSAIKSRAYALHLQFNTSSKTEGLKLLAATDLIQSAINFSGLSLVRLDSSDPLLVGAHALLDREMLWILCRKSDHENDRRACFAIAHELAHFWLHPEMQEDSFTDSEIEAIDNFADDQNFGTVEIGYSPDERREHEANIFAAEFLLPSPLLAKTFIEDRCSAHDIASKVGVSKSLVLNQLSAAVLLPIQAETQQAHTVPTCVEELDASVLIDNLDESQRSAACIERGPVLVDAGPGTGKTRTLIARIVHLVQRRGVPPENILALTFSNKASEEMRIRLQSALGESAHLVWIGTFHAFGLEILRKYGWFDSIPRMLEKADAASLLENSLDRLPLNHYEYLNMPALPFPSLISCFHRAKDELKTPQDYLIAAEKAVLSATNAAESIAAEKALEAAHVYQVYEEILAEKSRLDYGDLLNRAIKLLDDDHSVLLRLQNQYPFILADEYQDINRASAKLLQRLAGNGSGFWAVGDLRQAIYRFRGASPANVEQFENDFPGGVRLSLGVNYRSRPQLVSLFNDISDVMHSQSGITALNTQPTKGWTSFRADDQTPNISCVETESEIAQAQWIATNILEQQSSGVPLHDQAVLCRTNAQASHLASELERLGIPTLYTRSLLQRDEIMDLLALLSLVLNKDGAALLRVGQFREYSIFEADLKILMTAAAENEESILEAVERSPTIAQISQQSQPGIALLTKHLQQCAYETNPARILMHYLFTYSAYLQSLFPIDTHEKQQKTMAIYQLISAAQNFTSRSREDEGSAGVRFLRYIRMLTLCGEGRTLGAANMSDKLEAVRVMTVHASKGLEFHNVYVPNLNNNQFPVRNQGSMAVLPKGLLPEDNCPENELEDANERRLFFVALTRTRDRLFLSRSQSRNGKPTKISPLLQEIKPTLVSMEVWMKPAPYLEVENRQPTHESISEGTNLNNLDRNSFSESELRTYMDCPRKYYYQHTLALPDSGRKSSYYLFASCLRKSMDWMQACFRSGQSLTSEVIINEFEENWMRVCGNTPDAHRELLRTRGAEMLNHYFLELLECSELKMNEPLHVRRDNVQISLSSEQIETLENGALRITHYSKSRPKPEDKNDKRLALLRVAAKQKYPNTSIELQLHYLSDGSKVPVKSSSAYEPNRVEKYFDAVRDIKTGRFVANPGELRCCQCPFFFICPI